MQSVDYAKIVEVGPRDGFQSLGTWIETQDKIEVVLGLLEAGVDEIEVSSFVSPKAVPQMKDAKEVVAGVLSNANCSKLYALVPNLKGAELAQDAGLKNITFVISASKAHNHSNVRKTPLESLGELGKIRQAFPDLNIKLDIATAFGCPFSGKVSWQDLSFLIDEALALDLKYLVLCDTTGVANPREVQGLLSQLQQQYTDSEIRWSMHMHNTRGLALANILVGLNFGLKYFETSFGGLGGCPFAPGASGNISTEDSVFMLQEMGIKNNIDLKKLLTFSDRALSKLGLKPDSKINLHTVHKTVSAN